MASTKSLVLLPGLLCDRAAWADQCEQLADSVECIVPAYGALDTIGAMAEHVLASVPAQKFALAGHSMGGRIALEVTRRAPQRVERLALLDTGYKPLADGEAGDKERAGRMALLGTARRLGMRAMGKAWARGMVHPDRLDTPLFDAVLDMIERSNPDIFAAQINALLNRPDAGAALGAIACPTLVLCGREDTWSPPPQHEQIARQIAGSTMVLIEHSGHMSTMEQPAAVNQALLSWLGR
jgi:pimeloyl-ACP methyl ester carboxylesterase